MHSARQLLHLVRGVTRSPSLRPLNLLSRRTLPRLLSSQSSTGTHQTGSETGQSGPSDEAKDRARRLTVATGAATAFFGASYILYLQLKVRAASDDEDGTEEESEEAEEESKKKGDRVSFHDQRVIAYENRLRAYSTPDKLFRLFATLNITTEDGDSTIYMTPNDFMRAITPGVMQPSGLGLDKFRNMTIQQWRERCEEDMALDPDSVFTKMGNYGLLSFSEYLFLLTLLATPARQFEIAFMMFDLDGNGEVDVNEFEKVQQVILSSTAVGARHRDHRTTGNIAGSVGDTLVKHFFGPSQDQLLTADKFKEFYSHFRRDVLKMEFERFNHVDGRISEYDFAKFILSYSQVNEQGRKKYLARMKKAYNKDDPGYKFVGISFDDVQAISSLIQSIQDVETALSMYLAAGASITGNDLKDVTKAVTGIELSDHLVEVIITLFDEDNDGNLTHKEFIKVMKSRASRGLNKPKELGVARLLASLGACTSKTVKEQLGIKS